MGADGPQDYTRIFFESYADPNVAWRPGAKKILVNFGDNVPHDNNLNEGVTGGIWSTGGDPGRDEIMFTDDDLDLQTVLASMMANYVILLECHTSAYALGHWTYWTGITGGALYITGSPTLPDDVAMAVTTGLTVPTVTDLHLAAISGYESWLSSVPSLYASVSPGTTIIFEETIYVPAGTTPGTYTFTVSALDAASVSYGDQTVTITVPRPEIEVPLDIKPLSCPNPLNVSAQGVLPAAILGTADFDVTLVDLDSIELEGVSPLSSALEDVATPFVPFTGKRAANDCTTASADGYMDLTLKFDNQEIVSALGTVSDGEVRVLKLTGNLKPEFGGTQIRGEDVAIIREKGKAAPSARAFIFSAPSPYPQPSNPEVWIPYTLGKGVEVSITIYNASGRLIRTLNLGYQNAGEYISKAKTAYWDGKNENGEKVSSGLYFYTIQAGNFAATKRMILLK